MVGLIELGEENWMDFAELSVYESQKQYLASNIGIIARGYVYRECDARVIGITPDDTAVKLAPEFIRTWPHGSILPEERHAACQL